MLLRDERGRTDKSVKETEVLLQKALKLQRETDDEVRDWLSGAGATRVLEAATMCTHAATMCMQAHGVSGLAAEHAQRKNELSLRCDELAATKLEVARQLKMTENYAKKCQKSNDRVATAEAAREVAKARNVELEEQLASVRAERETTRKALDVQLRERDIENKHLVKASSLPCLPPRSPPPPPLPRRPYSLPCLRTAHPWPRSNRVALLPRLRRASATRSRSTWSRSTRTPARTSSRRSRGTSPTRTSSAR